MYHRRDFWSVLEAYPAGLLRQIAAGHNVWYGSPEVTCHRSEIKCHEPSFPYRSGEKTPSQKTGNKPVRLRRTAVDDLHVE